MEPSRRQAVLDRLRRQSLRQQLAPRDHAVLMPDKRPDPTWLNRCTPDRG
jgi:hypothetical protein